VSADSSADSSPEETVPEAPEIETVASVVTETGEEPAEAAPAPKKRRTRKKAEEAPGDDKPKRRTTRRKKTADVDGEAVAKDSPGDKGAPSESATAQDGPSETGNEDSAPADSARPEMEKPEAESSEPLKRGWWQRRKLFG
jgi:ribonuclease E